nr:SHOCT domain-containing protein [Nocardia pneumoniae]
MMFWYDHDMSGWGYAWMGIGMVVFWAALITGFVLLVKYATQTDRSQPQGPQRPTAEQVLAERFARGEIDRDEYLNRLDTLRSPTISTTRKTTNQ